MDEKFMLGIFSLCFFLVCYNIESEEPVVFNANPINIAHSPAYTVDGVIDEVKFWAKALTPDEINVAMEGEAAVKLSREKLTTS